MGEETQQTKNYKQTKGCNKVGKQFHLIISTRLSPFWKLNIELEFKASSSKPGLTIKC